MQIVKRTDTLNGLDLRIIRHLCDLRDTGTGHFTVHDHITCTTVALAAADLTAGQQQTVS